MALTVMQLLPALEIGGVERGTLEIAAALTARGHRALVVSGGGSMVAELCAAGAEHFEYPIGKKSLRTVLMIGRLKQLMVNEGVDIVHARSRLPAWIGHRALRAIPRERRPRWVTTVHGPYSVNAYSRIMTSGERVIAISEFIRDYIQRNYPQVAPARIRTVPRGIDRSHYAAGYRPPREWQIHWRNEYPALSGRRLLVLPGRLTRWKGQADFIKLIGNLCVRGEPVHGLIVGGAAAARAPFEAELKSLVAAQGLSTKITFLGHRDDLREILALADIAYSLTAEPEAFGRTTIEALSLGTPVIGYDHGGTREILKVVLPQGLVAPRDINGVADLTQAFLADPVTVPTTHPFTLERMQTDTVDIYERLVADAHTA